MLVPMRCTPWAWALFAVPTLIAQAPPPPSTPPATGFLAATIEHGGESYRYVVYVPRDYTAAHPWPLLVFLNGAGECGRDGWKQVGTGLGPAILNDAAKWPFVVLFPQKPDRPSQWEDHEALVLAELAAVRAQYAIDSGRTFLTGLSQGGHGTWVLGARHPELWAAIVPVCGYGDAKVLAPALAKTPVWAFHGEDDRAVPVRQSKDLCLAIERAGGHAELTLYPRTGHDSWKKAYAEAALVPWLLADAAVRDGVRLCAAPELVERARLTIRRDWSSDAGPPFEGTTTVVAEFDSNRLTWHYEAKTDTLDQQRGELTVREGREFVAARLRELYAAGVLGLPDPITPAKLDGIAMASDAYEFELVLGRGERTWRFHRDVPRLASFDPALAKPVGAIRQCLEAVAGLR